MADTPPSAVDAKKPPRRRKTPIALVLMIALSFSAVSATVLLSKDMRNLRRLAAFAGVDMAEIKPKPHAKPEYFGPPQPIRSVVLNPHLAQPADVDMATALRRTWQMSGAEMCKALRTAGIEPTDWMPAAIGSNLYECSYDKAYRQEGSRVVSSLFVVVRGNGAGTINSLRVKLVDPPKDPAGNLDPAIVKVLETLLTQSRWGDFADELEAMRTLKDVKKQGFGATLRFYHDFDKPKNFNFMLTLEAQSSEQRRTNPFFSREVWFGGTGTSPAAAPEAGFNPPVDGQETVPALTPEPAPAGAPKGLAGLPGFQGMTITHVDSMPEGTGLGAGSAGATPTIQTSSDPASEPVGGLGPNGVPIGRMPADARKALQAPSEPVFQDNLPAEIRQRIRELEGPRKSTRGIAPYARGRPQDSPFQN